MIRVSAKDYKNLAKKKNKYLNDEKIVDGIRFQSKAEADYYCDLKMWQSLGIVKYFLRQVPIYLPGRTKYVVDFIEFHSNGDVQYTDVKGIETTLFKTKKREIEAVYPIEIRVVKRARKQNERRRRQVC